MLSHHLPALLSLAFCLFPTQIAAAQSCSSVCDSYTSALKSCQKTSGNSATNVTLVGSAIDTDSVHCMCVSSSSYTQMNSCTGCAETDVSVAETVDVTVLVAWSTTCKADNQFGDKQAALCWQGQPLDYMPCVSRTTTGGSSGGGSGSLSGAGSSSSAGTLPESTSGGTAATPSANAKSAGPLSFPMSIPLSVMLIAFGMVIGL